MANDCADVVSMEKVVGMLNESLVPYSAFFEVTYRCNARCEHCYLDIGAGEMTLEEIEQVLDTLKRLGAYQLVVTGGEPFIREDILDILRLAKTKRFATRVFTNGTLIDESIVRALGELGTTWFEISLLASSDETYERITHIPDGLQRVKEAVALLKANRQIVMAKSPLLSLNYHERHTIPDLARTMGAIWRGFDPTIMPTVTGDAKPRQYALSYDQMLEYYTETIQAGGFRDELFSVRGEEIMEKRVCGAGVDIVAITPDGRMSPCAGFRCSAPSILTEGVDPLAVWREHEAFVEMRKLKLKDLQGCENCDDAFICSRCPAVAVAVNGDVRRPASYHCASAGALREAHKFVRS